MTVRFQHATQIGAAIEKVFDLALSIDAHAGSMARYGERPVAGVTSGSIGLGQVVTWRARHFGVPWTMTSRIVQLERPTSFTDEQVRGPFARFHHEHVFTETDGGTEMLDRVSFDAPLGVFGRVVEIGLGPYVRRLIERRDSYLKDIAEGSAGGP